MKVLYLTSLFLLISGVDAIEHRRNSQNNGQSIKSLVQRARSGERRQYYSLDKSYDSVDRYAKMFSDIDGKGIIHYASSQEEEENERKAAKVVSDA